MLFATLLGVFVAVSPAVAAPSHAKRVFGNSKIRVKDDSKCFDVPDSKSDIGTPVQL